MADLEMTSPINIFEKGKLYAQQYFQLVKLFQKEGIQWISGHLQKDCEESWGL